MRKALLLILALALAVTTVMALAEDGTEEPTTPPAVTTEAPETPETSKAPEETEGLTETAEPTATDEATEPTEPGAEEPTTEPENTETPEETETPEPPAETTEGATAVPTAEPTELPTPEPTIDQAVAIPMGDAPQEDVVPMAGELPATSYVVTFPAQIKLAPQHMAGKLPIDLEFGAEVTGVKMSISTHNGWKLQAKGNPVSISYEIPVLSAGEKGYGRIDNALTRHEELDVYLKDDADLTVVGQFSDTLTFEVTEVVTIWSDPTVGPGPGIEEVGGQMPSVEYD